MEEKTVIADLTKGLLTQIGFKVTVEITEQDSLLSVHLKTDDDASFLIGKHAHMLSSLQRVLSAMVYNKFQKIGKNQIPRDARRKTQYESKQHSKQDI